MLSFTLELALPSGFPILRAGYSFLITSLQIYGAQLLPGITVAALRESLSIY